MSANLSHAAQGFVNCVVVGKDIVPRLSVVNIGRLIDELASPLASAASSAFQLNQAAACLVYPIVVSKQNSFTVVSHQHLAPHRWAGESLSL